VFVLGGKRAGERDQPNTNQELPIYPVIGESGDHIRVVVIGDAASLALWIPRHDAAATALVPVRLGDEHGTADPVSGVTLGAGVTLAAQPAANGLRQVNLVNTYLDATGYAPAAAIGEVWLAPEREPYDPASTKTSEPAPNATGSEVAAGPIRDAGRDDAAVIATAKLPLPVRVIRKLPGWDEIEIHATRVRVHGFVPAATVTDNPEPRLYDTFGHGGGYGISDTAEIDVPAGVCIYDRPGGEVIGVELAAKQRYAHGNDQPGWWSVVVGNDWGILWVAVHDISQATDPKAASWETCKK
jgi:hypothetical protein